MNAKTILAMIEKHVEKGILGIALASVVLMGFMYLLRSPNKVPFGGQELGPRELFQTVADQAQGLKSAVANAKPEEIQGQAANRELVKLHNEGIFAPIPPAKPDAADAKPIKIVPIARALTTGGGEIVVPGLSEIEEANGSIALIKPLPPEQPQVSTGRSMAVRKAPKLGGPVTPAPAAADDKSNEPTEVGWASIAAYWDKDAHKKEMQNAGYAAYRSKVYVAGVDVERQELLASGEWSEPKVVEGSHAMPDFKIPDPAIDDQGSLVNKSDLDEAFNAVRSQQSTLMQSPFFAVTAGDEWKVPPLEGHIELDEEGEKAPVVRARPERTTRQQLTRPTFSRSAGGGGGGGENRFGGGSDMMGGGEMRGGGGGGGGMSQKDILEAKKRAREELREASTALDKKDYNTALSKAQSVENNEHASAGDKNRAKDIAAKAQEKMNEAGAAEGPGRMIGSDSRMMGGDDIMMGPRGLAMGGPRGMGAAAAPTAAQTLITHPDRDVPAVFYHDDSVEAGKTYRYRMRVNLWNRYVGRIKALKDPAGAKQAILHGEWSLWSEPTTITPSTHFYLTSIKPGTDTAILEVWKWINGKWIKRNVEASVGEAIGGEFTLKAEEVGSSGDDAKARSESFATGAVVLDLRMDQPVKVRISKGKGAFDYREQNSLVLVYLDPADGQVKERVQVLDNLDPLRKKLKEEARDGG